VADNIAAGHAALKVGNWQAARDNFRQALPHGEPAEALFGLGVAHWWLGDMRGTLEHPERAYLSFLNRPDPVHAMRQASETVHKCEPGWFPSFLVRLRVAHASRARRAAPRDCEAL